MTVPLNPDHCVNCQKCGKQFEMVWGENNDVCGECGKMSTVITKFSTPLPGEIDSYEPVPFDIEKLIAVQEFYANPDNWRRFPVDTGTDANGSPVQQYFWIGDGGEFARTNLQPSE